MIELVKLGLETLAKLVSDWVASSAEQRIELERRTLEGLQVMRGERKAAHDEIDARTAETRRVIEEAKRSEAEAGSK
jgi:hypothetical protein